MARLTWSISDRAAASERTSAKARDRALAKFRGRAERVHPFVAFGLTLLEALAALLLARWFFRLVTRRFGASRGVPGRAAAS